MSLAPLLAALLTACVGDTWEPSSMPTSKITLVESVPAGTTLDDPAIADAGEALWDLITKARERIEVEQFYIASAPGTQVEALLDELVAAGARGVVVRVLVDAKLSETYPEPLERLRAAEGVELRVWDYAATFGSGVQHAKLLLVDGQRAYVGSHNLDWRALTEILELGAVLEGEAAVTPYADVFELDWALAGGEQVSFSDPGPPSDDLGFLAEPDARQGRLSWGFPMFSPRGALPQPDTWELPMLLTMLDAAEERAQVQVLSYATVGYDGDYFDDLDRALRRANARGVAVQLLVSDWAKHEKSLYDLMSLAALENVEVRFVVIPQPEGRFVPFGRVAHAKFMVIDGKFAWLGSSNWSGDYFLSSRNVGLFSDSAEVAGALAERFTRTWSSEYAEALELGKAYAPPPRTEEEQAARDAEDALP
ncbi:MAG: hypothetical protein H6740_07570 [Alphaproteobacteria bacterium]|nr:hypothetical protein [Alphaproteobacteria bacterium]